MTRSQGNPTNATLRSISEVTKATPSFNPSASNCEPIKMQAEPFGTAFKNNSLFQNLYTLWLFTRNDFKVILYPQTAIGVFNALAGDLMTTNSSPDLLKVLARLPRVLLWNWINLLVFNIANQRLPNSIIEDSVNKPWRPLPSRRITPNGSRKALLALIPTSFLLILLLGGVSETVSMLILTWMYNDLGGADENYVVRNLINAAGFMCHGSGSTKIAAGAYELTHRAYSWLAIIGGVVFTTLQVQDLPDMEGDAVRGRRTLPLVHGDWVGRCSVAGPVLVWSLLCPHFWGLDVLGFVLPVAIGGLVVIRTLTTKEVAADQDTYKLWCLWLSIIYALPLCKNHDVFIRISHNIPQLTSVLKLNGHFPVTLSSTNLSVLALGLSLVSVPSGLLFLVAMYRLTWHPLAKWPGPWLGCLSDWYSVYQCMTGNRHLDFYKLHQKYGPVVRFGPNRISVNTTAALRDIYGTHANTEKSEVYNAFRHFFKVPATLTTIDKRIHAFKRRVAVQALTQQSVKELEESMLHSIREFCRLLVDEGEPGADWSTGRDMTKMVSYALSDIMGDLTFSRNWNTQKGAENRHMLKLLPQGTCGINMSGHMPALLTLKLDQLLFPKLVKETYQFRALSQSQSDWRIAQGNSLKQKDLFGALMKAEDPQTGRRYTEEELIAEAGILIVAGSDTTATSLTSTLFYLLHYPSSLTHAQIEVRGTFKSIEDVRIGAQLTSCRFLFACIDEAMRLSPAIGAILPRKVLPGGINIDGEYFPAGIDVGVPTYSIHHDSKHYPSPFDFKPERWLPGISTSDSAVDLARSAFCPFGVGRTSCVGKYLAYQEMGIMLARMLWLYDMRLKPGSTLGEGQRGLGEGRRRSKEFQTYDKFVSTHEGPLVEFQRR